MNNKQSMKLYTEEQVKQMIDAAHNGIYFYDDILKKHTPIELPGHFEILDEARKEESSKEHYAFIRAIRWISSKIEGDNK